MERVVTPRPASELSNEALLDQPARQLGIPDHVHVGAVLLLQLGDPSATSPWSTVEFCHSRGSVSVVDA